VQQLVAPTGGKLYSLEIDPTRIDVCEMELEKRGLDQYVEFMLGDSVDSLVELKCRHVRVNFAWLDSLEDAQHARDEHNAVHSLLMEKHILCVDDHGSPNSVKWQDASAYIKENYYASRTYDTPTGLIVGYNE
jgi:tRNA A58 N-methylase Trm61